MADHSKPTTTSTYTNFVTELDGRLDDLAVGLDPAVTTPTNLITGAIRWSSAANTWQKWNGSAWNDLSSNFTLTNVTATSFSGPHNGTVGATTPNTGAFTTLSASGAVTFSSGTINGTSVGATTPSTGAFTTLAASGAVTLSGGTANGVAYLNGSKVVTSGSALTFDGTNLGLGVGTPGYRVDIASADTTANLGYALRLRSNATATAAAIQFTNSGATGQTGLIAVTDAGVMNFSNFMSLNASGNLGVGVTNVTGYRFAVQGGDARVISAGWTMGGTYTPQSGDVGIGRESGGGMIFATNGTERGRFDASGNFLFNSGYGSVAVAYGCRAWVNFNGTGTVARRGWGNVDSVTDGGVGTYTVNFTNGMPDTNYSVVCTAGNGGANTIGTSTMLGTVATGSIQVYTNNTNVNLADYSHVHVAVFR